MTLYDFSQKRLAEYAEVNLQPRTVEKYREELDGIILPALGRVKLIAINPAMMRCAVEWELLEKNPCSRVRVAAVPKTF